MSDIGEGSAYWHMERTINGLREGNVALQVRVETLERDLAASQIVTRIIDEERQELISLRQQVATLTAERDRLLEFVTWAASADAGVWAFQIREKAQAALRGEGG